MFYHLSRRTPRKQVTPGRFGDISTIFGPIVLDRPRQTINELHLRGLTSYVSYTCTTIIPFLPAIKDILCLFHQPFTAPDFRFQMLIIGRYLNLRSTIPARTPTWACNTNRNDFLEKVIESIYAWPVFSNKELWCVYVEVPRSLICTRRRG